MDEMLKRDFKYSAGGAAAGAAGGAWIGSSIGIAALGTAAAGTIPVLVTGAIVGGLGTYACRSIARRVRVGKRQNTVGNSE